jgi:hypothetical protein
MEPDSFCSKMHKTDRTLDGLIDGWLVKLSGAEFKLAAYLYRNISRRRKKPLSMSIAALAAATGISWRQMQAALKKLDELGIILRTGGRGRITCVQLPGRETPAPVQPSVAPPGYVAGPPQSRPESSIAEVAANASAPSDETDEVLPAHGKTTQAPVLVQGAIREHLSRLLYHLKTPGRREACVQLPGSGDTSQASKTTVQPTVAFASSAAANPESSINKPAAVPPKAQPESSIAELAAKAYRPLTAAELRQLQEIPDMPPESDLPWALK